MIPGTKSPYYEQMRCRSCGSVIARRRGVVNPLCEDCKREIKRDRNRKRKVVHISKPS